MKKILELDAIDAEILSILQADATQSIQDIANQIGLTNNPCWRRIKRLEERGVIERRAAIINPKIIGLSSTLFVSIRVDTHEGQWLEQFAHCINQIPEIIECHRISGDVDYLLKVIVRDLEHYDQVYRRLISQISGLRDVSSRFSLEELKHGTAIDVITSRQHEDSVG
jgi:Lrp/AsnC family transcriptional regulator